MNTLTNQELYVTSSRLTSRIYRRSVRIGDIKLKISVAKRENPKKVADEYSVSRAKVRFISKLNDSVSVQRTIFKNRCCVVLNYVVAKLEALAAKMLNADKQVLGSYKLGFEKLSIGSRADGGMEYL